MLLLQGGPAPQPHHVSPYSISSKTMKAKNQKNFQWMCLLLGVAFWRLNFGKFYLQIRYRFCSANLQTKRIGDFLAAAQAYSVESWPSQAAGKGISGLSAKALCVCLCTTACNAAQRRGDLVRFVNRKITSVSAERMHTSMTQAALIAVLAVCQTFFICFFI